MNFKSIIMIGLILLTLATITAVSAETASVGNSTFTIPEGYTLSQEYGDQIILTDNNTAITMYEGPIINPEDAKNKRVKMGYTLIGEDTYNADGITVNQQNYKDDGIISCVYTFKKNNKYYIITLNLDEGDKIPEHEDNPVTGIINTLE